ncbi:hypothetical protein PpBr36_04919 [Pyricularia pennisetigena]|uniref:hypothetical protein n=1 Tax=Pyricularia pennisetigena TaxID=1578925 RepID=UPI0011520948|nr:hypothetical protein PpBr36_04919 [Pyricularia pennisetigena]TLS26373.1 hypothetical protein PpBr36_04919 [Pyricularia pennisetigena]
MPYSRGHLSTRPRRQEGGTQPRRAFYRGDHSVESYCNQVRSLFTKLCPKKYWSVAALFNNDALALLVITEINLQEVGTPGPVMDRVMWNAARTYLISLFVEQGIATLETHFWCDAIPDDKCNVDHDSYESLIGDLIAMIIYLFESQE